MTQPLTDEQLWGVPPQEMPDPSSSQPVDGWCSIHETQCSFWLVNYGHAGCALSKCKYFPDR
jgi:hypothetical protein